MTRYFFDIRVHTGTDPDDEGLELRDVRAAKVEAAHALADIARDAVQSDNGHDVTIDVRTKDGPLFQAAYHLQITNAKYPFK